ncbi:MAG TPA: ParB/RepB/Spo0J family partition protein [Terriglobales bacterium]|nr:ParB/RepB/Spo0J family partition protein [Terriglobales bacterium]
MTTTAEKTAVEEKAAEKAPADKRKALGRGLESLLPGGPRVVTSNPIARPATPGAQPAVIPEIQAVRAPAGDGVLEIALDAIDTNPYQTRLSQHLDAQRDTGGGTLAELAESIRANGVIQPITVRPGKDGRYVLITGERRWRASKLAGKTKVPAIVKVVSDQQAAEMTIVENLQRQDLNCLEQAHAFAKLSQDFRMTQEQIGHRVGVSRETVSNYMRLLKLPPMVGQYLSEGRLGFSEARTLLTLPTPELMQKVADEAVTKHLSFEQIEERVMAINLPLKKDGEPQGRARWVDPNVRAAQSALERTLGVRVRIRDRKGKGKIVIEYSTLEDFDRVVEMLKGK